MAVGKRTKGLSIDRSLERWLGISLGGGEGGKIQFNSLSVIIG